jgi:hypothetical protein
VKDAHSTRTPSQSRQRQAPCQPGSCARQRLAPGLEQLLPVKIELHGHYPAILTDAVVGAQASELFGDAKAILERVVAERWLKAKAVVGFWPATRIGDDIEIQHQGEAIRLHHLRQQADKPVERPNLCLADFIAPRESGVTDWIGGFAVTAGLGIEPHLERFRQDNDDYSAIILKALADRLRSVDCRGLSGHPSRSRLSGLCRPHRKGHPVPHPGGHPQCLRGIDRRICHVPGGGGIRLVFQPPRKASTSSLGACHASRLWTMPNARVGNCRRPSAGWLQTWITTRSRWLHHSPPIVASTRSCRTIQPAMSSTTFILTCPGANSLAGPGGSSIGIMV